LAHSKVAASDTSRLGERILAALAKAERGLDEAAAKALGPAVGL
jgi:hypothetical protein